MRENNGMKLSQKLFERGEKFGRVIFAIPLLPKWPRERCRPKNSAIICCRIIFILRIM